MKLSEHRYFRIGKGPITLFVSIPYYRSQTEVISRFPDGKMSCKTGPYRRWRKLLDRLSRQIEIGQRIENPERGVDVVEAIPLDDYWNVKRQLLDWQWAREAEAVRRANRRRQENK